MPRTKVPKKTHEKEVDHYFLLKCMAALTTAAIVTAAAVTIAIKTSATAATLAASKMLLASSFLAFTPMLPAIIGVMALVLLLAFASSTNNRTTLYTNPGYGYRGPTIFSPNNHVHRNNGNWGGQTHGHGGGAFGGQTHGHGGGAFGGQTHGHGGPFGGNTHGHR